MEDMEDHSVSGDTSPTTAAVGFTDKNQLWLKPARKAKKKQKQLGKRSLSGGSKGDIEERELCKIIDCVCITGGMYMYMYVKCLQEVFIHVHVCSNPSYKFLWACKVLRKFYMCVVIHTLFFPRYSIW